MPLALPPPLPLPVRMLLACAHLHSAHCHCRCLQTPGLRGPHTIIDDSAADGSAANDDTVDSSLTLSEPSPLVNFSAPQAATEDLGLGCAGPEKWRRQQQRRQYVIRCFRCVMQSCAQSR